MKKNLLFLTALFMVAIGYSQTFTDNFITYNIISTTPGLVEATNYDAVNGGTNVTIPNTVNYNSQSYVVVMIANNAFLNKGLTSATIGDNIVSIGNKAFQQNALSTVTIPNNVITINSEAFADNSLTSVIIGYSVETIGFRTFGNNQLTSVSLPISLTGIDVRAFETNSIASVTIPDNVTNIGLAAFRYNPLSCITSEATTPPTITTEANINDSFAADRSGIDLSIPTGTSSAYATATWTGFNSVTEGLSGTFTKDHITYQINPSPFNEVTATDYNVAGGTVVNIPATIEHACTTFTVTEIGNYAFASNNTNDPNNLTSVTLPNTITYIGVGAFSINNITTLTIPDSVINIDDGAFANSLNLTNLVLGNNLTTIGDFSFRFCPLNDITIPASVTNIGVVAFGGFGGADAITDIYCQGMVPPTISTSSAPNSDTFNQARSTIHLHIPAGTMGAYVTDTGALWTGFNPVTEDALSTNDFELQNNIKIITASNAINIITDASIQLEGYTIYNISGQKIANGADSEISTTSFATGIYILKLDFDRGTVVKKVVIN